VAANVQRVTLAMKLEGFAGIKNIGKDFKNLNKTLKLTAPQLDKLVKSITKVHGNTKLSKAAFEKQISTLSKLKNNVGIGTVAYKKLSTELDKVRAKMNAVTAAAAPQGGMFSRLNKRFQKIPVGGRAALGALAGTATAGLGSTGQLAFAGGAVGGPAGVAIGAGLGAAIDTVSFAGEAATYASEIQKLEIALAGVTKDQATFEEGLRIITETSKNLNVPIAASTKQFTTLAASVLGAGGTIEDAEEVFTGVSNAIKATGGNSEDVQSAIRAMSQIFGKGKVSAEELQGQLGERLAGAVVKFAEANGSSLQKLQKDLRDGTVGLDQVIKFAQKLNIDFGETARKVADSSADAGARLKVQMDNMKLAVGEAVLPIGAAFQSAFSDIVKGITESEEAMAFITTTFKAIGVAAFGTFAAIRFLTRAFVDLVKILYQVSQLDFVGAFKTARKGFKDTAATAVKDYKALADIDLFNTKGNKTKSPSSYTVAGVTYDMATGRPLNQGGGLPTLTGEDDGKGAEAAKNKIIKLERTIKLKGIEDETDRKLLERQYKLIDAVREINKTYKDDDVNRQKLIDLENTNFQIDKTNILTKSIKDAKTETFNLNEEFKKLIDSTTDLQTNIGKFALDFTNRLGDAFADFFVEGKRGFADLARSAVKELNKIIVKAAFMKFIADPILGFLNLKSADGNVIDGGEVVPSAKGNIFAKNKIVPYAYGGIVDKPTLFPMANGMGLMGEAGPEAVMPLKRGSNGKLGVQSSGGVGNIVVNVDASGSSVQGDSAQSQEFGRALAAAIQSEMLKQKRPGGLLT